MVQFPRHLERLDFGTVTPMWNPELILNILVNHTNTHAVPNVFRPLTIEVTISHFKIHLEIVLGCWRHKARRYFQNFYGKHATANVFCNIKINNGTYQQTYTLCQLARRFSSNSDALSTLKPFSKNVRKTIIYKQVVLFYTLSPYYIYNHFLGKTSYFSLVHNKCESWNHVSNLYLNVN